MTSHDLVVSGGLLVDGTGSPPRPADVAIAGDRIAAVEPPGVLHGERRIDATGMVVTPGFFDIHSHADFTLAVDGRAQSALLQGVTSIVTGNCGFSAAPLHRRARDLAPTFMPGWRVDVEPRRQWSTFGDYVEHLRTSRVGVNVFPLVGHGALRLSVTAYEDRHLSSAETADLCALAREAIDAGAIGWSTGLEYAPGAAAPIEELLAVAAAVGDCLYATHCRNRTDRVEAATAEAIRIAATGGARLQLSHFVPRPAFADRDPFARALDLARNAAVDVAFDVFPFDHGPTPLSFALPAWAREGSRADVATRLADPALRDRIAADVDPRFLALASGAEMYVVADGGDGTHVGSTLTELSGPGSVVSAALDLLAAAGEDFGAVTILEEWAAATDLVSAIAAPDFLLMGDGLTSALDGPLAGRAFSLSDWGYVPMMLKTYVRDLGVVSLEDAVHRMTQAPAVRSGVLDRGTVVAGAAADLVVLDLDLLDANHDPRRIEAPTGIRHVVVNGVPAVSGGRTTGSLTGQVGLSGVSSGRGSRPGR